MIRVVVTLLVALYALLPPGVCLCQLVPSGTAARQERATPRAAPPANAPQESCCSCRACREGPAKEVPPAHAPAAAPDAGDGGQPSLPSAPCSGCPAVSAGPAARLAILPVAERVAADTAVHIVLPSEDVTRWRSERVDSTFTAPAPPLFVRHCAFLI